MQTLRLLLATFAISLAACKEGPDVTVCIMRAIPTEPEPYFLCVPPDGDTYRLSPELADKYVAFSSEDAEKLLSYCGVSKK